MSTSEQTPSVEIISGSKKFGAFTALQDIDLSIGQGEIVSLLGPSGCGKTTLMRLIAGFEEPTTGTVRIDGQDVAGVPPEGREVNMVFQRYALFPHLDVYNNVAFGLSVRGVDKGELNRRVHEMLEIVHLEAFASRQISELSGGQSQRVALARALVNRPKVLLLDEPLAALDLKIRQHMLVEMKRIHRETGATFVYVTHDQDEALILSDRIALIERGRIMQIDRPQEMYERPRTIFAAKFLGETNLLEGVVQSSNHESATVKINGWVPVTSHVTTNFNVGDKVVASIRPETIRISQDDANNESSAIVEDITYIGARSFCRLRLPNGEALRVQVQGPDSLTLPGIGETASISCDADHLVFLTA